MKVSGLDDPAMPFDSAKKSGLVTRQEGTLVAGWARSSFIRMTKIIATRDVSKRSTREGGIIVKPPDFRFHANEGWPVASMSLRSAAKPTARDR